MYQDNDTVEIVLLKSPNGSNATNMTARHSLIGLMLRLLDGLI